MKHPKKSPCKTHEQTWLLLPWYINETLTPAERQFVEEHLKVCAICKRERADLQKLSAYAQQHAVPGQAPQAAFARLLQRIDSEATHPRIKRAIFSGVQDFFYRRLMCSLSKLIEPMPIRVAAAALVLVLLAAPAGLLFTSDRFEGFNASYRTLSNPRAIQNSRRADINVIFAETLEQRERLRILGSIQGEIISGPNTRGVYRIKINPEHGSELHRAAAIATLRREAGVLFAEPASPPEAPLAVQDGQ